ncbi:MAG: DUF448 domain-containing protein [Pseudomonadota bacterium]
MTRETAAHSALIRLALGPDGEVMPDLAARAPGRGAWLGVDAKTLEQAQAKGRLKGALARAFKGDAKRIPDNLADTIGAGLERQALNRLGLEMRAGHLTLGFERVLAAAKSGAAHLVLHAGDAGADGAAKIDRALRPRAAGAATLQSAPGKAKSLRLPADRAALSMALGQGNVVHVAVTDPAAAVRIGAATGRWQAFFGLVEDHDEPVDLEVETGAAEGVERQV